MPEFETEIVFANCKRMKSQPNQKKKNNIPLIGECHGYYVDTCLHEIESIARFVENLLLFVKLHFLQKLFWTSGTRINTFLKLATCSNISYDAYSESFQNVLFLVEWISA